MTQQADNMKWLDEAMGMYENEPKKVSTQFTLLENLVATVVWLEARVKELESKHEVDVSLGNVRDPRCDIVSSPMKIKG